MTMLYPLLLLTIKIASSQEQLLIFSSLALQDSQTLSLCFQSTNEGQLIEVLCIQDQSSIWECETSKENKNLCRLRNASNMFIIEEGRVEAAGEECEKHSDCNDVLDRCVTKQKWERPMCVNFKSQPLRELRCGLHQYDTIQGCKSCDSNCQTCAGPEECTSCHDRYLLSLQDKSCVNSCPVDEYTFHNACVKCHSSCSGCSSTSQLDCLQCQPGYKRNPSTGECLTECLSGTYLDQASNTCLSCDASCLECSSPSECTECAPSLLLENGECTSECSSHFFPLATHCQECEASCETCLYNPSHCLTCTYPLLFVPHSNTCVSECPANTYFLQDQGGFAQCALCNEECLTCSGPSAQECTSCPPNSLFFQARNTCYNQCLPESFYNTALSSCQYCDQKCAKCSEPSLCDLCFSPFKLSSQGLCVDECSLAQYADSQGICQSCPPTCSSCLDASTCTSCFSHFFLHHGQCISPCPSGSFSNGTECIKCDPHCAECYGSPSSCTECQSSLLLSPLTNPCLTSCPDGFYQDEASCLQCNDSCATCSGQHTFQCLSCPPGKLLQDGSCVAACSPGFYSPHPDYCLHCHQTCSQCLGPAPSDCTACWPHHFHLPSGTTGSCEWECPSGFFLDPPSTCTPCHSSCDSCEGPLQTQCTSCSQGLALLTTPIGSCASSCNDQQYLHNGKCYNCHPSCSTCFGPNSNNCLSCYHFFIPAESRCVSSCPSQFYTQASVCLPCHPFCSSCNGPLALNCLSCSSPSFLSPFKTECVDSCPPHSYSSSQTTCLTCDPECANCTGPSNTECSSCLQPFALEHSSHTCTLQCPPGYFSIQGECSPCSQSCLSCSSQSTCLSCQPPFVLNPLTLQCSSSDCPSGHFQVTSECKCKSYILIIECNSRCAECVGPDLNDCLSCPSSLVLFQKQCLEQCPLAFYKNPDSQCQPCSQHCARCQDFSHCLQCQVTRQASGTPYYLHPDTLSCVAECPSHFFPYNGLCLPCDSNCQTCDGPSSSSCTSCVSSLYFNPLLQSCSISCTSGFYSQGMTCQPCHSDCAKCQGPLETECLTCSHSTSSLDPLTNRCQPSCPSGTFFSNQECQACHPTCNTCAGSLPSNCISCYAPLLYLSTYNTCVAQCPPGFYSHNNLCLLCSESCEDCTSPTECLSCKPGYFYSQATHQCLLSCPSHSFLSSRRCQECASKCGECVDSPSNCTQCPQDAIKHAQTCVSTCPSGFFQSDQSCQACSQGCSECSGSSPSECSACFSPFYLFNGYCLECPQLQASSLPLQAISVCYISYSPLTVRSLFETQINPYYAQIVKSPSSYALNSHNLLNRAALALLNQTNQFTYTSSLLQAHSIPLTDLYILEIALSPLIELNLPSIPRSEAKLNTIVWKHGLYQSFNQNNKYALSLRLLTEASQNLAIQLTTERDPFVVSQWNQSKGLFDKSRIVNSSFSIIQDGCYQIAQVSQIPTLEKSTLQRIEDKYYIFEIMFFGIETIALVTALIFDICGHKKNSYPHEKQRPHSTGLSERSNSAGLAEQITQDGIFTRVYRFSLLYNLPVFSIFSFKDRQICCFAKVLWTWTLIAAIVATSAFLTHFTEVRLIGLWIMLAFAIGLLLLNHQLLFSFLKRQTQAHPFQPQTKPLLKPALFFIVCIVTQALAFHYFRWLSPSSFLLSILAVISGYGSISFKIFMSLRLALDYGASNTCVRLLLDNMTKMLLQSLTSPLERAPSDFMLVRRQESKLSNNEVIEVQVIQIDHSVLRRYLSDHIEQAERSPKKRMLLSSNNVIPQRREETPRRSRSSFKLMQISRSVSKLSE